MPKFVIVIVRIIEKIAGSLWKWKGRRIRNFHYGAVKRTGVAIFAISFLMFVIPLFCLFGYATILTILLIIILGTAFSFTCLRLSRDKLGKYYERMWQREGIARIIHDQGLLDTDYRDKKVKVTYFPKVYHDYKDENMYIRFPLKGKNQMKHMNLQNEIEATLYAEVTDVFQEKGYINYEIMCDMLSQRISIDDVICEAGRMRLMERVYWEYDKLPHMLIAGGTGGGKTYFILSIIKTLMTINADIKICDPKKADLSDLKEIMPNDVYDTVPQMIGALRDFCAKMLNQTEVMKKIPGYKTGMNYADVGLPPHFLIFDEYVAFNEMISEYKEKMFVEEYMKKIAMLGRQAGFFLIIGCQRPDAKYFADGIRDQFGFRVTLGKMYPVGYSMMFGDTDKVFVSKKIKGRGYADTGAGVISEFYSPLVPKGYDFMKVIGGLYGEKQKEKHVSDSVAVTE